MALTFPKINQLRFHQGAYLDTGAVNHDNREPDQKIWPGVYPHRFYQPIQKVWTGEGDVNELDFCIRSTEATWAAESKDCKIFHVLTWDRFGNPLTYYEDETLSPADFFTFSNGDHMYRFTESIGAYADGFYIIRIQDSGAGYQLYDSNIFEIATSFEDCYPFSATHFENNYGLIWENTTPTVWYLKLLIPYRMFKPVVKIEKDVYDNDSGGKITLQSTINRVFEFESLPIPLWYAETIQMATALSENYLNGDTINFEEVPSIEVINESNLCVLKGNCTLTSFNDNYELSI